MCGRCRAFFLASLLALVMLYFFLNYKPKIFTMKKTVDTISVHSAPEVPGLTVIHEAAPELLTTLKSETASPAQPLKLIMLWTPYRKHPDHSMGALGHSPFVDKGCDVTACATTTNRSQLLDSDAVVFHWRDTNNSTIMPKERRPNQVWVMFNLEPATYLKNNDIYLKGMINWTMTYRLDSDVVAPYGEVRPIGSWSNHGRPPPSRYGMYPPSTFVQKDNKTIGLVSWISSSCVVPSKRYLYIQELAKHIQVDTYGKCGKMLCPKGNKTLCFNLVYKYKFNLAFENSLCRDYVTEKLFRALYHGSAVPVVYGAADYLRQAPPHSFIDANDFQSPRHLADYLNMLDQNDALYQKYHAWRDNYQVVILNHLCYLCAKLHDPLMPKYKVYDSYSKWFFSEEDCKQPSWDVAPITNLRQNLGTFPKSWRDPSFRNRTV